MRKKRNKPEPNAAAPTRAERLLERAPATLYERRTAGLQAVTFISAGARRLLGFKPEAFAADPRLWASRVHPEDAEKLRTARRRLLARGRATVEYRFRHRDESYRWLRDEMTLVAEAGGRTKKILGALVDVSEIKEREEQLANITRTLRAMADAVPAVLNVKDRGHRYVFMNSYHAKKNGLEPKDALGKTTGQLFGRARGRRARARDEKVFASGRAIPPYEEEWKDGDGESRFSLTSKVPLFDDEGNVTHVATVAMDIGALKRAEAARREIENRARILRAVVDAVPAFLNAKDGRSRYVFMNRWQAERYGTTPEGALGKTAGELLNPDHGRRTEALDKQVFATGQAVLPYEEHWVDVHGTPHVSLATKVPLIDEHGRVANVVAVGIDIAELKKAEEALAESEARFRAFLDHSPSGLYMKDMAGRYVVFSDRAAARLGISADDAIGKTAHDIFPKDVADAFVAHERAALERGEAVEREHEFTVGGERRARLVVKFPIRNVAGAITGTGTIATSITERKRAEQALRESEARFRRLFHDAAVPTAVAGPDGRYAQVNRAFSELTGYAERELLKKTFLDITHPDDREANVAARNEALAKTGDRYQLEKRFVRKDGRVVSALVGVSVVRDGDGRILYSIGQHQDITARKAAEAALREREALFRAFVGHSPDAIFLKDADGRYLMINAKCEDEWGISEEQARGKTARDLYPAHHAELAEEHDRAVLETGRAIVREVVLARKGVERVLLASKFPIRDPSGKITAIGCIDTDITERKRMEEELRRSGALLHDAIDSVAGGVALFDRDDRLVLCNSRYTNPGSSIENLVKTGMTIEEITRVAARAGLYHPSMGETEAWIAKRVALHRSASGPHEHQYADGTWTEVREYKTHDGGTFVLGADVTRQKQMEEDLRRSGALLRDAFESMAGGVALYDRDDRLVLWNSRYPSPSVGIGSVVIVGMTFEEAVRAFLKGGYYHSSMGEAEDWVARRVALHRAAPSVHEHRDADGTWYEVREYKTHDGGTFLVRTDVTERKRAEEALEQSERRLRAITANLPGVVFQRRRDTDGGTSFTYISEGVRGLLEYAPENLLGGSERSFWTIFDDDREAYREAFARSAETLAPCAVDYRVIAKSGRVKWLRSLARPRLLDDGSVEWDGIFLDIEEIKKAEAQILQAKEQAELADRAKSDFLANMSHELRTPLNAVIGFSDMIKSEILGPIGIAKYREQASQIHKAGIHLLDLINDILDVSKIEAGALDFDEERFVVEEAVRDCVAMVRDRGEAAQVTLSVRCGEASDPFFGDRRRFKQIVLNLLANAVKFTKPGGRVEVRATVDADGRLEIAVEDTGIGIPAAELPNVTQPFRQVGGVHTRSREGTGLGLSLVKSLTELHGGRLRIESELGKGTRATVTFPRSRTVPPDA